MSILYPFHALHYTKVCLFGLWNINRHWFIIKTVEREIWR
uniref:Uncharacterized protein n=1 Tax=Myoviridae sp. ct3Oc10 TaxID=2825025 RepID=A0A8S5U737_9CAUD|nr:MAG TPA: hypothetical protein [Myoviridae sp. ct3Oc10]DAW00051.1 MAG TPA: hypothetical protein [Caudoviricetes sp.]